MPPRHLECVVLSTHHQLVGKKEGRIVGWEGWKAEATLDMKLESGCRTILSLGTSDRTAPKSLNLFAEVMVTKKAVFWVSKWRTVVASGTKGLPISLDSTRDRLHSGTVNFHGGWRWSIPFRKVLMSLWKKRGNLSMRARCAEFAARFQAWVREIWLLQGDQTGQYMCHCSRFRDKIMVEAYKKNLFHLVRWAHLLDGFLAISKTWWRNVQQGERGGLWKLMWKI